MCRTGQASFVPVLYSYGVGLGVLFAPRSLVVTALFNICRLGYAVVSGPRETGLLPCQPPIDSGSSSLSRPCTTIILLEHATPTASRHTLRLWACPTRMARAAVLC